jgi:hypothetical protein
MKRLMIAYALSIIPVATLHCEQQATPWSEFSFILKPSTIAGAGVGVFAMHDINEGTPLFRAERNITRTLKTKDLPQEFAKYGIYEENGLCRVPERFDRMEIGWYINHSATPNIGIRNCPERNGAARLYAIKNIKAGEEIVMDYNELGEPEESKEDYYKPSHVAEKK